MENLENGLGYAGTATSGAEFKAAVPSKISPWTKIRSFLFQEITVTMTPKQEKVLQEVHDFWHQDITAKKVHDFLFQEIKIVDNITL